MRGNKVDNDEAPQEGCSGVGVWLRAQICTVLNCGTFSSEYENDLCDD